MAKGDDSVRRKKNKINRKRMRNSEASVSARVASIIASKRRRKAGNRRICEGMCFSLPTPNDPFNDRASSKNKPTKPPSQNPNIRTQKKVVRQPGNAPNCEKEEEYNGNAVANSKQPYGKPKAPSKLGGKGSADDGSFEDGCLSKFLIVCLNTIRDAWKEEEEEEEEEEEGVLGRTMDGSFLTSTWGAEFWRCCSAGWNVVETSGACATREQVAWLVSTASDIVTRKEKQGIVLPSPFLLFLVPSQEKAVQVSCFC